MGNIKNNYNVVAKYLVDEYINRISGDDVEEYLIGEEPEERVMVGMLAANRVEKGYDGKYKENDESRFQSIPAISVTFILDKNSKGNIKIFPLGSLYYKVRPVYKYFEKYIIEKYSRKLENDYGKKFDSLNELNKYLKEEKYDNNVKLPAFYKKISLNNYLNEGIDVNIEKLINEGYISIKNSIDEKLNKLVLDIVNESITSSERTYKLEDIMTKIDFEKVVYSNNYSQSIPNWNFDITLECNKVKNGYRITVTYVNLTDDNRGISKQSAHSFNIFNASLKIKGDSTIIFKDIELDYFIDDYKNDVSVKAIAENTSCEFDCLENTISTINIPLYKQKRLITKDIYKDFTSFDSLLNNPIDSLSYIKNEMDNDYLRLVSQYNDEVKNTKLSKEVMCKYKKDIEGYKNEIERFTLGIELLKNNNLAFQAFKYMNLSFQKKLYEGQKVVPGWRLFQIVFIVSILYDIVNEPNIESYDNYSADLLYFPTGGGKTEAFLGCVVFNLFYDRLRGKNVGVTALIKYPLRLLSINQLERILTVICKAESIRSEYEVGEEVFSVGYLVGSSNTPNKITNGQELIESSEAQLNDKYRLIDRCPVCGEKNINIRFDSDVWRLVHMCDNPECKANILPLFMVDNEIYRYLPSVIVSTIDKLATIGLQSSFKSIFGEVKYRCPKHGYSYNKYCMENYSSKCNQALSKVEKLVDPAPTLFIQDELHLVRESLGTFASHYITFIKQYMLNFISEEYRKKIKFIGATATVSMYKNQLKNLYHIDGCRFPAVYPDLNNKGDFYSEIDDDDTCRLILGYAPYGRSVTNAIWQSTTIFRITIDKIWKNADEYLIELKELGFLGDKEELIKILNNYWVSINYNNTKQDGLDLFNSFQNQANNLLHEMGVDSFNIDQMTGDNTFQQVRQVLFDIQATKDKKDTKNLILATSTISHGVDEDSFNQMYFFGMPNNTAEYIQAYSRVGRRYTGIVIDIIRLLRERDRSYLKNFKLFHKYKDNLIDPVPINRWAKNAIYSTLPGLLMAIFIQYYENKLERSLDKAIEVKKAIKANEISIKEIIEVLTCAYECNDNERFSVVYKRIIEEEVPNIIKGIMDNGNMEIKTSAIIQKNTKYRKGPMTSLRDTEEQITISLKN